MLKKKAYLNKNILYKVHHEYYFYSLYYYKTLLYKFKDKFYALIYRGYNII
jgi:hypothetical protein